MLCDHLYFVQHHTEQNVRILRLIYKENMKETKRCNSTNISIILFKKTICTPGNRDENTKKTRNSSVEVQNIFVLLLLRFLFFIELF